MTSVTGFETRHEGGRMLFATVERYLSARLAEYTGDRKPAARYKLFLGDVLVEVVPRVNPTMSGAFVMGNHMNLRVNVDKRIGGFVLFCDGSVKATRYFLKMVSRPDPEAAAERHNAAMVAALLALLDTFVEIGDAARVLVVTIADIRNFYQMVVWHLQYRNNRNPHGVAFYKIADRFKLQDPKSILQWAWRELEPIRPDAATARWLKADYQRYKVAQRYARGVR